jgi:hypothetical protein
MHVFDVAAQTVAEALRSGHIGTPVAARVVAALTAGHGRIERQLARFLEVYANWLGSRPDQFTAFGGVESRQISAVARFETQRLWRRLDRFEAAGRSLATRHGSWR